MNKIFQKIDKKIISVSENIYSDTARFSIFLVFFWFGILKVFGLSPATELVLALLQKTMSFFNPDVFMIFFGLLEVFIGILFLVPRLERLAILFLFVHLATTISPLFLLPDYSWQSFLIPTLEGQYIIKNIMIAAIAIVVASGLKPQKRISIF